MLIFGTVLIFVFGTILGSFINVLVFRLRDEVEIVGRSRCLHCERELKPRHLVPILSWLWLRGRCAYCHQPIHVQYPLVELLAGLLMLGQFVSALSSVGPFSLLRFGLGSFFLLSLLALAVFDLRWQILPLELMGMLMLVFWTVQIWSGALSWMSVLAGIVVGGGFLGLQWMVSRGRWIGGGDPWLAAMIGAFLGLPQIGIALYFTYMIGGLVFIWLLILGRAKRGTRIAFAPLLAMGATCTVWFGHALEAWLRTVFGL